VKEWSAVKALVDKLPDDGDALATLQEGDELSTRMDEGKVFFGFQTEEPTFKPTFKVKKAYDLTYVEKRVPSWCDRVLWKSLPGFVNNVTLKLYEACKDYKTSDHKPIRAGFSVELPDALPPIEMRTEIVHFVITGLKASIMEHMWEERVTDTPDPFIVFLPEPTDLEITHLDEKAVKKGLIVGKAGKVKTHHLDNTYEPDWSAKKNPEITIAVKVAMLSDLEGCHLLLSCMDHDKLSNDDAIGSASLSLGDVYKMHVEEAGKPYVLSAPLEMNGMQRGNLSCVVKFVRTSHDELDL